ncbi:MAG: sugar transferase [Caldilineaceae bacterium]
MLSKSYQESGKRLLDLILVLYALLFLLPFLGLVALAVRLSSRGPIFYTQTRVGKDGRLFQAYKFRSMYVNNVDPSTTGEVTLDNPLVTPVGRIIRRLKIDEIPQLWNVVKGDMSPVGPRSTIPEHVEDYTPQERRRLDVMPGLTAGRR